MVDFPCKEIPFRCCYYLHLYVPFLNLICSSFSVPDGGRQSPTPFRTSVSSRRPEAWIGLRFLYNSTMCTEDTFAFVFPAGNDGVPDLKDNFRKNQKGQYVVYVPCINRA